MNKVYLLLRENRESGPYTIDELFQQQLKPSDLVWVEGKSVAWCYPSELDELKGRVQARPNLQVVPPSNPSMSSVRNEENRQEAQIFSIPSVAVSYKPDEIESKADQIRSNIISYAQENRTPYMRPNIEPSSGAIWNRNEDFQFVHHTRKKYVTLPQLIATGLITVLLASAWYGDWSTIRVKPNTITVASAPAAFNEQLPVQSVPNVSAVLPDSQMLAQGAATGLQQGFQHGAGSLPRRSSAQPLNNADSGAVEDAARSSVPENTVITNLASTETNAAQTEVKKEEPAPVEPKESKKEIVNNDKPKPEPEKQQVTEEKDEKKKKLGEVIKGIFKKKDKESE